jgi:hypothetical protein
MPEPKAINTLAVAWQYRIAGTSQIGAKTRDKSLKADEDKRMCLRKHKISFFLHMWTIEA